MDKTIEERIEEVAIDVGNNCVNFYGNEVDYCCIEDGLRQIATEQKAIDDDHFRDVREMVIDKACKSFCDTLCPNECRLKSGICPFEDRFRKTLKKAIEE